MVKIFLSYLDVYEMRKLPTKWQSQCSLVAHNFHMTKDSMLWLLDYRVVTERSYVYRRQELLFIKRKDNLASVTSVQIKTQWCKTAIREISWSNCQTGTMRGNDQKKKSSWVIRLWRILCENSLLWLMMSKQKMGLWIFDKSFVLVLLTRMAFQKDVFFL